MNDDEEMAGYTPDDFYEDDEDPGLVHDVFYRLPKARTVNAGNIMELSLNTEPSIFPGGSLLVLPGSTPSFTTTNSAICPDLLTIEQIGAADNLRGRVVRAFFRVMEWIPW